MDPEEVSKAFDKLHKDGKVKSFGVSNYLPCEYKMLKSYLNVPLITNQVELSCLHMENLENGTIPMCLEERIHPMIWSPLAGFYRCSCIFMAAFTSCESSADNWFRRDEICEKTCGSTEI